LQKFCIYIYIYIYIYPDINYLVLCKQYIFVVCLEILRHEVEIRCAITECEANQVNTQKIPRFLSTLAKIV